MIALINESNTHSIIHSANNFEEATNLLTETTDLVLLDINMPGKNGIVLLKTIKESSNSCKVIMLSNHSGEFYQAQCKKMGAHLILDKTNEFDLVPGIVKGLYN
jgi:two-component system chemotaxis response regulator CheY